MMSATLKLRTSKHTYPRIETELEFALMVHQLSSTTIGCELVRFSPATKCWQIPLVGFNSDYFLHLMLSARRGGSKESGCKSGRKLLATRSYKETTENISKVFAIYQSGSQAIHSAACCFALREIMALAEFPLKMRLSLQRCQDSHSTGETALGYHRNCKLPRQMFGWRPLPFVPHTAPKES